MLKSASKIRIKRSSRQQLKSLKLLHTVPGSKFHIFGCSVLAELHWPTRPSCSHCDTCSLRSFEDGIYRFSSICRNGKRITHSRRRCEESSGIERNVSCMGLCQFVSLKNSHRNEREGILGRAIAQTEYFLPPDFVLWCKNFHPRTRINKNPSSSKYQPKNRIEVLYLRNPCCGVQLILGSHLVSLLQIEFSDAPEPKAAGSTLKRLPL